MSANVNQQSEQKNSAETTTPSANNNMSSTKSATDTGAQPSNNTQSQASASSDTPTNVTSDNHGLVDEHDVYGAQFADDDIISADNDEQLDARWAFMLKPEHANGGGRLIQLFSGIANDSDVFFGYNIRQWQDKKQDGHEIPEPSRHYAAFRRSDPVAINTTGTDDFGFTDDMFTNREFYTEDDLSAMSISCELKPVEELIWNADSEQDALAAIDALQNVADPDETESSRTIVPPENPDNKSELTQSRPEFLWSHIVGHPVLKCKLNANGVYEPVEVAQYEWNDENDKTQGVKRIE